MSRAALASLAAAVLVTSAACTEELEPYDRGETAAKVAAELDDDPTVDTLVPTECAAPKVMICHIPFGIPENAHNVCVSEWAVEPHVALHGDTPGDCQAEHTMPPPVCMPLGSECSVDEQCCSDACVWDECIDHI